MTRSQTQLQTEIHAAIAAKDAPLAQSLLNNYAETLTQTKRITLQARVHISAGQPQKAVSCLEETYGKDVSERASINREFAHAYLANDQPRKALKRLKHLARDLGAERTESDFYSHIRALSQLDAPSRMIKVIRAALRAHPESAWLKHTAILKLAQAGAFQRSLKVLNSTDSNLIPSRILTEIVAIYLQEEQVECLIELERELQSLRRIVLMGVMEKVTEDSGNAEEWDRLHSTLAAFIDRTTNISTLYALSQSAFHSGLGEIGDKALLRYQTLGKNVSDRSTSGDKSDTTTLDDWAKEKENVVNWLGIPEDRRRDWLVQNLDEHNRQLATRKWLALSAENFEAFSQSFPPADLGLLKEVAGQSEPAILTATHAGEMLGTLMHLVTNDIPVKIMGGDIVLKRVIPGADRFISIPIVEAPVRAARRIISIIRANEIVGLAVDGTRGERLTPFEHGGFLFNLPNSIPHLVFKYGAHPIWVSTQWQNGQQVFECCEGPRTHPDETFEDFRVRWFTYLLDKIKAICLMDARNAQFNTRIIRGPAI